MSLIAATVPCRLNRLFGIFLYKIAIFTRLKSYLNEVKNPPFFHQLHLSLWKPFQAILVQKFQGILELQAIELSVSIFIY